MLSSSIEYRPSKLTQQVNSQQMQTDGRLQIPPTQVSKQVQIEKKGQNKSREEIFYHMKVFFYCDQLQEVSL